MIKYKSISASLIGSFLIGVILFSSTLLWLHNGRSSLAAPLATTWYVNDATGSDGNSCLASGSACATISGAVSKAALEDVIEIAAGTYTENLVVQDLTLNGAGAGSTILDGDMSGRTLEASGTVTVTDMTIRNGSDGADTIGGGGILNFGTLLVQDSVVSENNNSNSGGGIFNNSHLTLVNTEVSDNVADSAGGGIYNYYNGVLTVTNSLILDNSANQGGGLYSLGKVNLMDTTVQGNDAETIGGAVAIWNGMAVFDSITVYQNEAISYGAGILNNGGVITVTNTTISGNSAPDYVGLANIGASVEATVLNSTIAYNNVTSAGSSRYGGVTNISGGTLTIQNSIVAQNDGRQCLSSDNWSSVGNNLGSDTYCDFDEASDIELVDPLLAPLGDYGGATFTHALNPSSPAIDAGSNAACPATDQRGVTRPVDGDNNATAVCDIGAFEAQNQLNIADVSVSEGDSGTTDMIFTVTLSPASSQTVTVDYATAGDTAVAGDDYNDTSGQLTFDPGEISQTITVTVNGDPDDEPDEMFTVTLSGASNADIIDGEAIGTIVDNDGLSSLTITDQTVDEGDNGTTTAIFTVTLSPAASDTVTVNYTTANNTAVAGADYSTASGQLTFDPNETSQTIEVTVNGDDTDEGVAETFFVNLSNASNANIVDSQGIGTITDDETAVISIAYGPEVVEGDSGSKTAVFTVNLTNPANFPITVDYTTEDGFGDSGADAGSDYAAKSSTLTFDPGETSQNINITVYGDTESEPDERFNVRTSNGDPAPILASVASGNILNDDDLKVYLPFIVR